MKTYLIDGYNLGHKIPGIPRLLHQQNFLMAIEHIVHFVQKCLNPNKHKVIIVFDGKKGVFSQNHFSTNVEIWFAKKPQTADDVIRQYVRKAQKPSSITVISSDREIIFSAKDLGAQVITSEAFCRSTNGNQKLVNSDLDEKPDVENIDVDYWLNEFNQRNDENDF